MALVHPGHAAAAPTLAATAWAPALLWAAAAVLAAAPVAPAVQVQALLVGVALTGAPHGALDIDQAVWATRGRGGAARLLVFLAAYLLLVAVGLAGWRWAPGATLVAFLLAAAWHFGEDEDGAAAAPGPPPGLRARLVRTGARGGAVILPAALLHPAAVIPLFAALAGASPAAVAGTAHAVVPALCAGWAALLAAALAALLREGRRGAAAELLGLAALFALAPPLAAFAVYFCAVHAVRHAWAVAARSGARRPAAWLVARWIPAALASGLVLAFLAGRGGPEGAVLWSFRLLAALTLPHLVFGPALERARPGGRR